MTPDPRHTPRSGRVARPGRRCHRGQGGMSLIEVLLAVTLMSIVVLGIAAGFRTTATVSGNAGGRAALQEALNTTTDRVATIAYPGCSNAAQITSLLTAAHVAPAGFRAEVIAVTYLVPAGPCTATTSALKLTVRVVADHDPTAELGGEVVLRNAAARP